MTAQGSSGYSYYASQTIRTLRGLFDTGVNAAGWSTNAEACATNSNKGEQDDAPRSEGPLAQRERLSELPRRSNGALKKTSRPSVAQLFDVLLDHEDTGVLDRHAKADVHPRHNANLSNGSIETLELDKVLFHIGSARDPHNVDSTAKLPLLALCPCNIPSGLTDLIVSQLSNRLDSYAQDSYMLVIFASPSRPIPVQHLIRYYRGLSSEARRNVQRLWICHPGLFTKIAVRLFLNTIVSGNVTRKGKVRLVDSLSVLAQEVDLSDFAVPPDVLMHDYKVNGKYSLGNGDLPVFGASLTEYMSDGRLPLPINQAIQHLRTGSNLQTVGLFRKVPSITTLEVCKEAYDSNLRVDLSQWPDSAILAGSIMKNYLRSLKYPIFPSALYDIIKKCPNDGDKAVGYIQETLLPRLEEEHPDGACVVILLEAVMRLLRDVSSFQELNQMDSHNLAVVFLPVLVRSADIRQDALMCTMPRKTNPNNQLNQQLQHESSLGMIIKLCIDRYNDVFVRQRDGLHHMAMTSDSRGTSATSKSTTTQEQSSKTSAHHQNQGPARANNATLRLLGSPTTVRKNLNGKAARSEATRESARGLFSRE